MIALGCDFAGLPLKEAIMEHLDKRGLAYKDFGTYTTDRCDYPVYAKLATRAVQSGECEKGMLFCGSGVGISLAANKHKGIRCVVCSEPYSAELSRKHNNTNMLALGARVVGTELAKMIVDAWLDAEFEGGVHQQRLDMITEIEAEQL